ncbi:MAG: hypothetical protein HC917_06325 [Richelia sp. SM2_1_7]|nr:hypothetical protein [Richelia sp. SM2_1_7]
MIDNAKDWLELNPESSYSEELLEEVFKLLNLVDVQDWKQSGFCNKTHLIIK